MRKLSTRLHGPRKLATKIAVTIAAALGIMLGVVAPAHAAGSSTSLQTATSTHTCHNLGDYDGDQAIFCVDLALYLTQAGHYDVTLQVEGYCQVDTGGTTPCSSIYTYGTVANPSNTDWRVFSCSSSCPTDKSNGRTYFYPYGGIPITPGGNCDNDIWGVLEGNLTSTISAPNNVTYELVPQLETGHYNVCLSAAGKLSATPA